MALTKCKLGKLIEEVDRRNVTLSYDLSFVRGISNTKEITETKADVDPQIISKFYVIFPGEFIYNPRTTRMGEKVGLGYNNTNSPLLFTFNNIAFRVRKSAAKLLLSDYLYIYFNRNEFDRYAMTHSWGSATELFSFEEMCDIDIELPPLPIQQKYVDIYKAMVANQQSYEHGLEDLKLVCDGYIEDLRRKMPCEPIGKYLQESDCRNDVGLTADAVRGISTNKELIPTKADMDGVGLDNYKIVKPGQIAYVPDTSRRGDKISLGFNNTQDTFLVSSIYTVFGTKTESLIPEYLMLFLTRAEFDRYARFHSWGSARETFDWDEMSDVKIPIPDVKIQKAIAEVFSVYNARKRINERLKVQIKDICPILIKGSLEEGST